MHLVSLKTVRKLVLMWLKDHLVTRLFSTCFIKNHKDLFFYLLTCQETAPESQDQSQKEKYIKLQSSDSFYCIAYQASGVTLKAERSSVSKFSFTFCVY